MASWRRVRKDDYKGVDVKGKTLVCSLTIRPSPIPPGRCAPIKTFGGKQ
jgi:hypothetical protein